MEEKKIFILGVGHNTPVYIELAEACGYQVAGLYHFNNERTDEIYFGYKILGSFDDLFMKNKLDGICFALSQGDNKIRRDVFYRIKNMGGEIPTLIHPTATVSKFSKLGTGVIIHINAVVHPDVTIGENTVLSYNTAISHSSQVGSHCYLAFNAMIGAYTQVGDLVFFGIGAKTISGKVEYIHDGAYIGAGSLVTKSINAYNVVMGSPAKVIRVIETESEFITDISESNPT